MTGGDDRLDLKPPADISWVEFDTIGEPRWVAWVVIATGVLGGLLLIAVAVLGSLGYFG